MTSLKSLVLISALSLSASLAFAHDTSSAPQTQGTSIGCACEVFTFPETSNTYVVLTTSYSNGNKQRTTIDQVITKASLESSMDDCRQLLKGMRSWGTCPK